MKRGQLYVQALPDAVTLYWRKPKNAPVQAEYDIFLDGQRVGSAYRTGALRLHSDLALHLDGRGTPGYGPA